MFNHINLWYFQKLILKCQNLKSDENYSKIDLRIKNQLIINFEDHNYSNYFLNTEKKSVGNSFKASMAAQSAGERDNKSFDSQLFVRIINNYEFYILENKIILKTVKFKNEYLKTINKELKIIYY